MYIFALFGLPVTGTLAIRARHSASARLAGYLAGLLALVLAGLVVAAFLAHPG